ncbi:ANK1 protein, partial [Polypterus senegalus]|nr:ANK1 protein [Polypterus senegalus]
MQYSLPSPLGADPYWQEVSSLECAPIATTEEDTLMEMSDVHVWPSGASPSLVVVEDSSLECSNAEDSDATLEGRAISSSLDLVEDEVVDLDLASNGLDQGQRSEVRRLEQEDKLQELSEQATATELSTEDGLSLISGQQQRVYARLSNSPILSRVPERNGERSLDKSGMGSFLSYIQDQSVASWQAVPESSHSWSQPHLTETSMLGGQTVDSGHPRVSQESLLQSVRDMGHSEILHGHYFGPQSFEKGLGFQHRDDEFRTWMSTAEDRLRGTFQYIHRELDQELGEGEEVADDEEAVTTRVVRRRVILKGDEVEDIPEEQVSEEQFTDEHGNIVTKKIVRKVVRTVKTSNEPEEKEVSIEGALQEPAELEAEAEQLMNYAILRRDNSNKVRP